MNMKNEIREKLKIYQGKTILSIGYGETDNQGRGKGYFKITFTDKSQIEILPDLFGVSLEVNFRN